jgi:thiol-disulfide isomerase/thioredoxin
MTGTHDHRSERGRGVGERRQGEVRRRTATGVVLVFLMVGCGSPSRAPASGAAGGAKPEFADLDRIHATLAGLRGRPLFVHFWATWCVPCVEELPDLAALSREDAVRGTGFVGISLDAWVTGNGHETEDRVKRALADAGVGYTNLIYQGDQDPLLEGFQLPGPIPYSVLYDGQGQRTASWTGKAAIEEVRQAIAAASTKGKAPAARTPGTPSGRGAAPAPAAPASPPSTRRPPAGSAPAGSSRAAPAR